MTFRRTIRENYVPLPLSFAVAKDFDNLNEIGRGAFGSVSSGTYHYGGKDPDLKKLTSNRIVMKTSLSTSSDSEGEDQEMTTSSYLFKASKKKGDSFSKKISSGLPIIYKGKIALIGEFVSYNDSGQKSANLESYFKKIRSKNISSKNDEPLLSTEKTCKEAFMGNNLGITLARIGFSKKVAQNSLHELGIFHFDTADRNFLLKSDLTTVITDFGFSQFIPWNGVYLKGEGKGPLNWINTKALIEGEYTIETECYALKVSMLESLGSNFGIDPFRGMKALAFTEHRNKKYKKEMTYKEADEMILKEMFEHIESGLRKQMDNNLDNNPSLRIYMESYRKYLTTMPHESKVYNADTLEKYRNEDNQRLLQAVNDFKQKMNSHFEKSEDNASIKARLSTLGNDDLVVSKNIFVNQKEQSAYQSTTIRNKKVTQLIQSELEIPIVEKKPLKNRLDILQVITSDESSSFWKKQGWFVNKMPGGIPEIKMILGKNIGDEEKWNDLKKIAKSNEKSAKKDITKNLYHAILHNDLEKLMAIHTEISGIEYKSIASHTEQLAQSQRRETQDLNRGTEEQEEVQDFDIETQQPYANTQQMEMYGNQPQENRNITEREHTEIPENDSITTEPISTSRSVEPRHSSAANIFARLSASPSSKSSPIEIAQQNLAMTKMEEKHDPQKTENKTSESKETTDESNTTPRKPSF